MAEGDRWHPPGTLGTRPSRVPETIENNWESFYWDYPDVYNRFAVSSKAVCAALADLLPLDGAAIVDVGSGTGRSTFELAKRGRLVIGIEPWEPPRRFAVDKARKEGIQNVAFVEGVAQCLPLREQSVDIVIAVAGIPLLYPSELNPQELVGDAYIRDGLRAVRRGGYVVSVEGAPHSTIPFLDLPPDWVNPYCQKIADLFASKHGFAYRDVEITQEYESLQEAVETYGFIYGPFVIEWLRRTGTYRFKGVWRIHYRQRLN